MANGAFIVGAQLASSRAIDKRRMAVATRAEREAFYRRTIEMRIQQEQQKKDQETADRKQRQGAIATTAATIGAAVAAPFAIPAITGVALSSAAIPSVMAGAAAVGGTIGSAFSGGRAPPPITIPQALQFGQQQIFRGQQATRLQQSQTRIDQRAQEDVRLDMWYQGASEAAPEVNFPGDIPKVELVEPSILDERLPGTRKPPRSMAQAALAEVTQGRN